jgi:hypothetical protein
MNISNMVLPQPFFPNFPFWKFFNDVLVFKRRMVLGSATLMLKNIHELSLNELVLYAFSSVSNSSLFMYHSFISSSSSYFSTPLPLERWGVCLIPRLPLHLRITVYSRQVISLALEARYLRQMDSQYLYPLGSPDGPAIPPGTGCSF